MRRGLFLLLLQVCLFVSSQNTPGGSRQTSYFTYLYRISSKQTEHILKKGMDEIDESYFQELAFQYPTDSLFDEKIPYGHYLKTKTIKNELVFELFTVSNVELRVMNNGADLNLVLFDLSGSEVKNARVKLGNRSLKFDDKTSMYQLRHNNGHGILTVTYEGVSSYFGLDKSIRYSKFRRSFNSVIYSKPLKYVAIPASLVVKSPIDLYKSVKTRRPKGIFYYIYKPFRDIVNTARRGYPEGFIRPIVCIFNEDHCNGNRDTKGFIALNKPKYRPGDTVRFKAYLTHHRDKLFRKELDVWVGTGWYMNRTTSKKVGTISAYQPGFYESSFVLSDSLKLKLDRGIKIFLVDRYETEMSVSFDYEDYVLDEANFSMSLSKEKIEARDSVVLTLKGTDANGLNLPDAKVKVQLLPRVINELDSDSLFVGNVLWENAQPLEASKETEIIIPANIFLNADIEYEVIANFQTVDFETHEVVKSIHFELEKPELRYEIVGDTLKSTFANGDSILVTSAQIREFNWEGMVLNTRNVTLPNSIRINPLATRYIITNPMLSKEVNLNDLNSDVDVYVNRDADSLHAQLVNPRNLEVRYFLYKGNKEILRGSDQTLNIDVKAQGSGNYFLALQFVWAGKAHDRNYSLSLEKANLNVASNLPSLIYPGKEQEVKLFVTDFKGKPVAGADITAYGIKSQFKQLRTPTLPDYNNPGKDRKLINNFNIRSSVLDKNIEKMALNWQLWNARMTLDSIEYYRFAYPENGIYQGTQPARDSISQIAPFVIKDGNIEPVHIIYVDEVPVFFSMADHQQTYSFRVSHGIHHVRLRTSTKEIEMDSIFIDRGLKTILSVDINSSNDRIKIVDRTYELTWTEKRLVATYLARIDLLTTFNYLEQNEVVFWNPLRRNDALIGPIKPNTLVNYVIKGDDPLKFHFEPSYHYSINDKYIKMKEIDFDKLTFKNTQMGLNDYVFSEDDIIEFWKKMEVKQQARFHYNEYPKKSETGNGSLALWNPYPEKLNPKNYLVFKESDPSFIRVYGGQEPIFHDLKPEIYHAFVLLENNDFIEKRNLFIRSHGTLYVALDSMDIKMSDSVSLHINEIIQNNVHSTYYSNVVIQQDFNTLKAIYNSTRRLNGDLVSGTVTDESGEGLPGVNVVIKGTTSGVTTDLDGRYQISVPVGAVLVFSSVGMTTQELVVGGRSYIDMAMSTDVTELSEVVVVGYGVTSERRALSSSVTTISSGLQGRIAGVSIQGTPGATPVIQVRGVSSVSGANSPIYVIDGVLYDGRELDVSPDDIASMEIMKGEQATSLYGSRAAGGVIIISLNKDSKAKKLIDEQIMDMSAFPDISQANPLRRNFSDYAFWLPKIKTDSKGQASFKVTFPDDVTSWKTNFIAIKKNKLVGYNQKDVRSFKPVMGTLSVPRFLVLGDSSQFIGRSLNYTSDTLSITSHFEWGDKELVQESHLIKSRLDSIYVTASSLDSIDVTYRMRTADGYEDGELRSIPVLPRGVNETKGFFKVLNGIQNLAISADSLSGNVTIRAEGNMLAVLFDEIEKIAKYPYGCNEQTASKLLALLAWKAINANLGKPFTHDELIKGHINRLEKSTNQEGLWGWWSEGATVNWITKHVLRALLTARKNGFEVSIKSQFVINELIGDFEKKGTNKIESLELLQLLEAKIDFADYINTIDVKPLSLEQQFRLVRLQQVNNMPYSLDSLWTNKKETIFGGLHWQQEGLWAYRNTNLLTVLALEILNEIEGHESEKQAIVNYLLAERKSVQWRNTYESTRILASLLPSLLKDGGDIKSASLSISGDLNVELKEFPFEKSLMLNEALHFDKVGSGPVYLTVFQKKFNPNPDRVEKDFVVNTSFDKDIFIKGEQVILKIKLEVKKEAEYVMLEIPVPAGTSYQDKPKGRYPEVHREYFMDRVAIFYSKISAGSYEIEIPLIPRYSGKYTLNPAKAELMYFPTEFGREGLKSVEIR